jgi:subtilisin family serine protease
LADALNQILESGRVNRCVSHFDLPDGVMEKRTAPCSMDDKVSAEFAHSGFIQIVPNKSKDCEDLVKQLNKRKSESVWKAGIAPKAVLAANHHSFEAAQGYLHSAPNGVDAMEVRTRPGGRGQGVTICDVEFDWNLNHVDLPRNIRLIGGARSGSADDIDHGTAVLGQMVSRSGRAGTIGICPGATAAVQSVIINRVQNIAGAIANASRQLRPGDVILIEVQINDPPLAVQFEDAEFSAIRAATERGITVVEAAGNGNQDFDASQYNGTNLQRDAGAIVVGAGVPPTNYYDFLGNTIPGQVRRTRYGPIGVPRSRIFFSNHGRIVNVQGWGWNVTTLGYGDAQWGNRNQLYTHRFNGTSSASPIVAGAVACIQGRARAQLGRPLTPAEVRRILVRTGTPQVAGPGVPLTENIGPLPNLAAAFQRI